MLMYNISVDTDDDRLLAIYNGAIEMCFEALHTLYSMHHEATACHVAGDLQELLNELVLLLGTLRLSSRFEGGNVKKSHAQPQAQQMEAQTSQKQSDHLKQLQQQSPQHCLLQKEKNLQQQLQLQQQHQSFLRQQSSSQHIASPKGLSDAVKRLATLLNTYNPPELCRLAIEVLRELVRNPNLDVINILTPILLNCHLIVASPTNIMGALGPYFPRSGSSGASKTNWASLAKSTPRPPRPMVQMSIPQSEILHRGIDEDYDAQIDAFYRPYHDFIDVIMRMAVNTNQLNETLVKLSCLVALEAVPLHFNFFPKFWVGIYNNKTTNK